MLGVLLVAWMLSSAAFVIAIGFFLFIAVFSALDNRRLRHLAAQRPGESICTFARQFDRRSVDPWIIRAVYEGLQTYYQGNVARFPFRTSDNLVGDLKIDEEDLDDLVRQIAVRIGRSMRGATHNPLNFRVKTVGDLVLFYVNQPKLHDA